jgi:hypothetical protein
MCGRPRADVFNTTEHVVALREAKVSKESFVIVGGVLLIGSLHDYCVLPERCTRQQIVCTLEGAEERSQKFSQRITDDSRERDRQYLFT